MMAEVSQSKRQVTQLSTHEKLEAIQRVNKGESKASVARIIGVPESTLRGWCKREDKLQALANKSSSLSKPVKPDGPSEAKRSKIENDSLCYWLSHEQLPQNMNGLKETEKSSWFWRWYKQHGLQMAAKESLEHHSLVNSKPNYLFLNQDKNNVKEGLKNNQNEDVNQVSEDEDKLPETADEALRHGEKFLRWLESCSDPSITTVQLLQFRYLLNSVRSSAERRAKNDGAEGSNKK